ncbi:hypothetical protein TNCT_250131 [Trichonephila clavata]|uniref:Uncharacterized protein n=1 Tax=Trichonephila clavata TaxID=2740835 RepID=A0A8X6KXB2_TRICU|nr:hypothetical protein TNCT_250131 [Trichonephila clavata]
MSVWLRNPAHSSAENELTGAYGNKLKNLLCFLKREVEGEERLQLARNGMKFEFNNGNLKSKKKQSLDETVPTASNLFSGDMKKRQLRYVFCDKSHEKLSGIKEPTEKISREEVVKFFNNTLSTDFDGRYMMRLPWTDNSSLPNSKNIAEKRLLVQQQ